MRTTPTHSFVLAGALLLLAAVPLPAQEVRDGMPDIQSTPTDDTVIDTDRAGSGPRSAAYDRMVEFMEQGYYDLAIQAAREVLELRRERFGDDSIRLVPALNNLARAQMLNGDLIDAELTYRHSIELTENHEGILSPRLINAFIGLGATYNRGGLHDQSVQAFKRALRLNHVNKGFYNLDQFIILDGLTEAHTGLKKYDDAHFYQTTQLEIAKRRFGHRDPRIVPTIFKVARWYERIGDNDTARLYFQDAAQILRRAYGKNDIAMVDALLGIADTYHHQGLFSESVRLMKKSLELLQNAPEPDHARIADVMVRIGDQYTNAGKPRTASTYYEDAWQELSIDEANLVLRDEYFSEPQRLTGVSLDVLRLGPGVREDGPGLEDGFVLLDYSVSPQGRAKDVTVVESEPPRVMDKALVRAFQRASFRPRLEDGRPVLAEHIMYRHEFRYRPDKASGDASDTAAAGSGKGKPKKGRLPYPDEVSP